MFNELGSLHDQNGALTFISKGTRCQESTGSARTRDCPLFPLTMCWAACRCTEISENQIRIWQCVDATLFRYMLQCFVQAVYHFVDISKKLAKTHPNTQVHQVSWKMHERQCSSCFSLYPFSRSWLLFWQKMYDIVYFTSGPQLEMITCEPWLFPGYGAAGVIHSSTFSWRCWLWAATGEGTCRNTLHSRFENKF